MAIKSAPYYWLECDGCGKRCEYGEFSAMGEKSLAIEIAVDESDWTTDDGQRFHCPSCPTLHQCEGCDGPAGEDAGERDYRCKACYEQTSRDAEAEEASAR